MTELNDLFDWTRRCWVASGDEHRYVVSHKRTKDIQMTVGRVRRRSQFWEWSVAGAAGEAASLHEAKLLVTSALRRSHDQR